MALPTPADNLGALEGYHSPQVEVAVRLNTNESPYPPPDAWVEEVAAELRRLPFHRYPDRSARALRDALGELHGVDRDHVFAANGSNEVLQTLFLAYAGPGRSAAVFEPTYAMHSQIAHVTGTRLVVGERKADFTLDAAAARALVEEERPDLTFLCSPNNPTGRIEPRALVEELLGVVPGLLVVDEAYAQFSSWTAAELLSDDVPLVVTRTYSKTWSMAGFRLGYLLGPTALVAELEKRVLPYHLDQVKQVAGRLALNHRAEMEERVSALVAGRERLAEGLADLPVDTWPSEANFVLFRPQDRDGSEVWQALVDRSVLVRNCDTWPRLRGCLRVTVGTPEENERFLAALTEVLTS